MVGIVAGFGAILGCMVMEGGNPASLVAPPALLLILVGTIGAATGGTSLEQALDALRSVSAAFADHSYDRAGIVTRAAAYADTARAEGLLALEDSIDAEEDRLLGSGLRLLVDGTDAAEIRHTLQAMVLTRKKVWDCRAEFFTKMGGYAPTLGIIGTVLGLIHTLEALGGDPSELGHLIAAAFIATFFGVTFANILFLPIGAKFKAIGQEEVETAQLVMVAVEMLANGTNPRSLRERLVAYLPDEQAEQVPEPSRKGA